MLSERVRFARAPQSAFFAVAALVFLASAAATIRWCASMSSMHEMPMPGGWTMSMTWMRMSGQSWLGAAASFVVMWVVMMVAMMLPPLVATLSRYRDALHQSGVPHVDRLTAIASAAYFVVWTAIGVAIFPLGVALAAFEMKEPALSRLVPAAAALIVTLAGLLQFTTWKARRLACCRAVPRRVLQTNAWRYGIHVAYHCVACCANLMTIVLILGVMDLRAMAAGTPAIAFERLAPNGDGAARAIGAVAIGTGLFLLARATRLV